MELRHLPPMNVKPTATLVPVLLALLASTAGAAGATITGRVVFEGAPPAAKVLPHQPKQVEGCCPDGKLPVLTDPTLLIDEKGNLANVVVTVEVEGTKIEPAKEPLVIDQKGCVFEPHVVVLPAGSKVRFVNSDTVTHNVRASSLKNDSFNWVMTPGQKEEVALAKADRVMIGCDYHPWMSMIVFVTDTPFHAVSAKDGTFSVAGLKPGTYKVKLWHERLGRGESQVVVKDDGSSEPIEVKMAEKKKKT